MISIQDASADYSQYLFCSYFQFPYVLYSEGYLNANVSMHQTEGTVGSANRNLLCYHRGSGADGAGAGNKKKRVLLKGLEHKIDVSNNLCSISWMYAGIGTKDTSFRFQIG